MHQTKIKKNTINLFDVFFLHIVKLMLQSIFCSFVFWDLPQKLDSVPTASKKYNLGLTGSGTY